MKSEKEPRN